MPQCDALRFQCNHGSFFFPVLIIFMAEEDPSVAGLEKYLFFKILFYFITLFYSILFFTSFLINIHFTVTLNFTLIPVNLTVKNDCLTRAVNLRLDPVHVYACVHTHTEPSTCRLCVYYNAV